MKTDIWMPIYIGDYLKDTMHLSAEEHGCYLLILMEMWNKDGWIPASAKYLSRVARVDVEKWSKEIAPVLGPFFREDEAGITQDRLLKEVIKAKNKRLAAQQSGLLGGRPKKPNGLPKRNRTVNQTGNRMGNPRESSSPSPSEEEKKTVLSFSEFWSIYDKKVGKATTEKIYSKVKEKDRTVIFLQLSRYIASTSEIKYRKNPATYLRQEAWNDTIITQSAEPLGDII